MNPPDTMVEPGSDVLDVCWTVVSVPFDVVSLGADRDGVAEGKLLLTESEGVEVVDRGSLFGKKVEEETLYNGQKLPSRIQRINYPLFSRLQAGCRISGSASRHR